MSTTTTRKIAVYSITASRPPSALVVKAANWRDANQHIAGSLIGAGDPTIFNIQYVITWSDGFKAEGTYEVRRNAKVDLAAHVKNVWLYYAGFWKPDHMSDEFHAKALAENPQRKADATKALQRYAMDDDASNIGPNAPVKAAQDIKPEPIGTGDIALVHDYVARLVQRVEAESPVNKALSLELRKALASIIRAAQITDTPRNG